LKYLGLQQISHSHVPLAFIRRPRAADMVTGPVRNGHGTPMRQEIETEISP
jgi:hypothetical protein